MAGTPDFSDWLAICNLKAAYCRLLDTKDWEGWGQLFTEDFHHDLSEAGSSVFDGRDVAVAATRSSIETAKTAHQVHFPEIHIDGDTATGVWPLQDRLIWEDGRSLTAFGHYHERYVRTADGWRVAAQKLTRLVMDFD